jgi:triacylglycerol lipase
VDVTRGEAGRFHDRNPAPTDVPCFSVAGEPTVETVCWPLRRFHAILSELDGPNDGLVSTESALAFGTALPVWPADHFRQMNWLMKGWAHYIGPLPLELYAQVIAYLASLGFGREDLRVSSASQDGPSLATDIPMERSEEFRRTRSAAESQSEVVDGGR